MKVPVEESGLTGLTTESLPAPPLKVPVPLPELL